MSLLKTISTVVFFIVNIIVVSNTCKSQNKLDNMNNFKKTNWEALNKNAVELIGKDWMLITAGKINDYNMMTASWGGLGWLWEKPVSFIFVRPQRYTHKFTEREDYYTLCFFDEKHREILSKMGSVSGRNFDKMNYEKLTAIETENGSVAFVEAAIIIECRKLYVTKIKEEDFVDKKIPTKVYPAKDFHTMYVGEIVNVWVRE